MARTTIPAELVAINAIQGTLIADNAITAVHIATNAVSGTLVADNAITSTHIAQNNVTATQIAMNTITVTQLADSAVETAKLNNDAVTQAKIADDAVGADQLAANSVVSASIVNGSIVAADLADNAVTLAKMASLARGKIIYGDSAGDPAALALGTAGTIITSDGTDISWSNTISGSPTDNLLKVNQTGSGGSHHGFEVDTASTSAWSFRAAVGGTTKLGVTGDYVYIRNSLGLGDASPDTKLHLKDDGAIELRLEADANNNGQEDCFIRFYTDGKTQEGIVGMDNNNSSSLFTTNTENAMVFGTVSNLPTVFATNNTEKMQITADGKVLMGVHQTNGTSAEYGQAQITCAPPTDGSHISGLGIGFQGNVAEGGSTGLDFFTKISLSGAKWNHASIRALTHGVTSSAYGSLQFYTMNATTMTEKMRIVSDGTVRIYQGGYGRPFALGSHWGYSSGYRAIVMGSASTTYTTNHTGSVTLSFNYNPSGNGSGAFSGNGNEIILEEVKAFLLQILLIMGGIISLL